MEKVGTQEIEIQSSQLINYSIESASEQAKIKYLEILHNEISNCLKNLELEKTQEKYSNISEYTYRLGIKQKDKETYLTIYEDCFLSIHQKNEYTFYQLSEEEYKAFDDLFQKIWYGKF